METRSLTRGEKALAQSVFGASLDLDAVTVRHRKWFPFQPRDTIMAPCGHIHIHPQSNLWSDDFGRERLGLQGLFLHELTHVWQAQQRGKYYLPLMRHPFCRYRYTFHPEWPLERYGIEQQAEIIRHVFLLRNGYPLSGIAPLPQLEAALPF